MSKFKRSEEKNLRENVDFATLGAMADVEDEEDEEDEEDQDDFLIMNTFGVSDEFHTLLNNIDDNTTSADILNMVKYL